MPEYRTGTGPYCNFREDLVKMLTSKLSQSELDALDCAGMNVVRDSIAEARERKPLQPTILMRLTPGTRRRK